MGDEWGGSGGHTKSQISDLEGSPARFQPQTEAISAPGMLSKPIYGKRKEESDSIQTHPSNDFPGPWDQRRNDSLQPSENFARKSPQNLKK